jgi:hypothetical protein
VATAVIRGVSAGFFRAEAAREAAGKSGVLAVACRAIGEEIWNWWEGEVEWFFFEILALDQGSGRGC